MPSPPPSLLLQPLLMGKRWGKAFLGVFWPFCTPSLLSWQSPASPQTKHPLPTPLSAMGGERGEEDGDEEQSHKLIAC